VAVALILVVGASLLLRSFARTQAVSLGFRTDHLLTVEFDTTTSPLRDRGESTRFLDELMLRMAGKPGVRMVAAATHVPLDGRHLADQPITREGVPALTRADSARVVQQAVTPNYFTAMGIALKKGRMFTGHDTADGKLVSILNETAARRYWPG